MLSSDRPDQPHNELTFTGERFIPHQGDPILALEHYHRYCFASRFVNGKRVLDIACGEGYGSAFLSKWAGEVVGVDSDGATIAHARRKYAAMQNLSFEIGSCEKAIAEPDSFDVVVSFETVEHIDRDCQTAFLGNVRKMLKQGGIFLVSSPDREQYIATTQVDHPYHKQEMSLAELKDFLGSYFRHVYICVQRVLTFSAMWQPEGWKNAQFRFHAAKDLSEEIPAGETFSPPLYLIAVCSDTPLAEGVLAESNSFYFDMSNIEETKRFLEWTQQLNDEVKKNREVIENLQKQMEERTDWAQSLERQIAERDAVIADREREIEERGKELEARTQWAHSLDLEIAKERDYGRRITEKLALITSSFFYRALARLKLIPK